MERNFKYFFSLIIILIITSCHTVNHKATLENANWLIGEWQNKADEGTTYEIWERQNDSLYTGTSFFLKGLDTLFSETITIEKKGDDLFYIPIVRNQNEGLPIRFKLITFTQTQLIFENPKHDFPQKITYSQITNDSILAEISGIIKGKVHSEKFPMKRSKNISE